MSETKIDEIKSLLEDIKSLLIISNDEKINKIKEDCFRGDDSMQKKIYDLCDGKTNEEIGNVIGKSADYVASNVSRLRQKGLVKTNDKDNKKIHFQRF